MTENGKVQAAELAVELRSESLTSTLLPEVEDLPSSGIERRLGFDFKLQVSNVWGFNRVPPRWRERLGDFPGGIHPYLVANLLYYFSEPGDTVVDPMAGSGVTGQIVAYYPYFRQVLPGAEGSGLRTVRLYDLIPARPGIEPRNIRDGIPLEDGVAGLTLLDPPYLNIPAKYYGDHPALLSKLSEAEWFAAISEVAAETWRISRPEGRVAVITNDYLKGQSFIPVGNEVVPLFTAAGFKLVALIYDIHNNYVYNANAFIVANAKRFRYRLNAMRQIAVFEKPIITAI